MFRKAVALVMVLVIGVTACASPTPEVIKEEVIVEKEVPVTVEVIKEVVVEKKVVQTVEVEKEVVVEKVVTATPMPAPAGGDVIIAMAGEAEPAVLDAQVHGIVETALLNSFLTDSLVCRDAKTGELKPWLVTDWETSEDGLMWTFYLRKDVKFQDGTPFNAEAVKYNLERILAPETMSVESAARLGPVKSVEVVDEYTVSITHENPFAPFLDAFAILKEPMWSPTALEKYGLEEFPEHLVGTGPFIFKEHVSGDHTTVVRNPDYNSPPACVDHTGPAYADSITWKWVAEEAVRAGIVKTGEAHIAYLPAQYVPDYEGDPNYKIVAGYNPGSGMQWVMNTGKSPLDDIKVRKAIIHAVDKEVIQQILFAGKLVISYGPMTPVTACYWEGAETMYPFDLDKANALLDEAGWEMNPSTGFREKDGQSLEIRWTSTSGREAFGEVVTEQLKRIGIGVAVESVPWTVQVERTANGDFEIVYERQRGTDPAFLYLMWSSKEAGPGGWAWTRFKDEKLDGLLDDANVETDQAKRCDYYVEAQKIIMENALTLGGWGEPNIWVMDESVKGFELGSMGVLYWPYGIRIEE